MSSGTLAQWLRKQQLNTLNTNLRMEPQVSVYAIVNPKNDEVLYVGASLYPSIRYMSHKTADEWSVYSHRGKTVKALNKEGLFPTLVILETCERVNGKDREDYWIDFYKSKGFIKKQGKSNYKCLTREQYKELDNAYFASINPVLERNQPEK